MKNWVRHHIDPVIMVTPTGIIQYFECPNNCGRKYKNKSDLMNKHLKFECGQPKRFKCDYCNKSFSRKENCKTHIGLKHKIIVS